ncbi:MAG: ABC transporter ATP-binding protein [Alphaproteobacteria bacterium]
MSALSFDHVSHAYGEVLAVDDISLSIEREELVCLIGPSGCGKTTALRVAAGLEPLQHGRVLMNGHVVADGTVDVPPEQRNVGLVFQDYALFPHLSVIDNVAFGLAGQGAVERKAGALAALSQVGMGEYATAYPHLLSGGQQQRVALARALAPKPSVMLLDEPFSGLDRALRDQVRDQALHVLKESGAATLMVTHDPEEAMFMADRVAIMRAGRIVQIGPPSDLYIAPKDAFVAGFFGEVNRLEGTVEGGRVATPLGALEVKDLASGTPVEVLIRPEALRLEEISAAGPSPGGVVARVLAARMLGRSSLIHLSVAAENGHDLHLHARIPGHFLPVEAAEMGISLDRSQVFVFSTADSTPDN